MKKKRIYNFYESSGDNSKNYSPKVIISPEVRGNSKFVKNVDTIFLHLKSGDIVTKTFSSNGACLVGNMKKTGELVISN